MNNYPDFLSPSAWNPQTATQAIKDLQTRVRDLERGQVNPPASSEVVAPAKGTILQSITSEGNGTVTLTDGVYADVASVTIRTKGGLIEIDGWGAVIENKSATAGIAWDCAVARDGSIVGSGGQVFFGSVDIAIFPMPVLHNEQPPAGVYTFSVQVRFSAASTSPPTSGYGAIRVREIAQ